ncbi:nickel pincer cofactor biosynthesis protein LarB [Tropicimonas sp. IMCC6043]|uniref:nickel pincer cofactor biosynthesis protein LarB n=1 Tax=Tropicimonas sp. IMCC6043 TaxID=2510645 RepID=UPI00101B9B2A|nr:nickel pincer cofactor biosynthesis protein LarB [Tropicimonas sp. IMCC6043]RYH06163.1 nickel pincer cofactor biosynthesis protein LarB [Tropicimonas sp. IMCC6043]
MTSERLPPYDPLRFDWERGARTGVHECVFCDGKSAEQIRHILATAQARGAQLLLTRLSAEALEALGGEFELDYCALSRTAVLGGLPAAGEPSEDIVLVCAGTSDLPVIEEARRTLAFHGIDAPVYADVGVAGLWRLMSVAEELSRFRVLIVVAGMEGALFSAIAGLVPGLVIAVPSPVGYGVSERGSAALNSALASCAPGIVTVNIGNGFGAAAAARKVVAAYHPEISRRVD